MKIYNTKLKKEIVDELQYLNEVYFQFDEPVPFINGLNIYPINVKNHDEFLTCSACLTLNRMDDPEGIALTNLGYLLKKMTDEKEGKMWSRYFSRLCELCFHIKNGIKCKTCGHITTFQEFFTGLSEKKDEFACECGSVDFEEVIGIRENPETKVKELKINGIFISNKDFDRFRQIVMYQNLPDYKDDSYVDIEVRKDQEETAKLRAKKNGGNGVANLERKIVCISTATNYKIEEIYQMSMRKFLILFGAVDDLITYITSRIGLMSGMVSMKEPLEHWIYKKEDDDIYGKAVDAGSFKQQINNPAAGK